MKLFWKILTWTIGVVTLLSCCYIMFHGLGLVPELDFGAGAYYYADIPEFDRYTTAAENAFASGEAGGDKAVPQWVYYALFAAWGYLMWRLWRRIEENKK